jgi:hypothetical protein
MLKFLFTAALLFHGKDGEGISDVCEDPKINPTILV